MASRNPWSSSMARMVALGCSPCSCPVSAESESLKNKLVNARLNTHRQLPYPQPQNGRASCATFPLRIEATPPARKVKPDTAFRFCHTEVEPPQIRGMIACKRHANRKKTCEAMPVAADRCAAWRDDSNGLRQEEQGEYFHPGAEFSVGRPEEQIVLRSGCVFSKEQRLHQRVGGAAQARGPGRS